MHELRRQWENLPGLIVEHIALRLDGPLTFSSFASVCQSWRSVSKSCKRGFLASQPPLLLYLPSPSTPINTAYIIAENRFHTLTNRVVAAALSDIRCHLGHSHGHLIGFDSSTCQIPTLIHILTGKKTYFPRIARVPWSSAVLTSPPTSTQCLLILHLRNSVHYCQVNGSRWKSRVFSQGDGNILNLVVHSNKLYVRFCSNKVEVMDTAGGSIQRVRTIIGPMNCLSELPMFVESDDELLLMWYDDREFEGYRLDLLAEGKSGWVRMEGLGGRSVFYTGDYWMQGFSGRGLKGVKGNCLYELPGANGFCESSKMRIRCVDDGEVEYFVGPYDFKVWLHPRDFEQWGLM